jgi:hypothetical protein
MKLKQVLPAVFAVVFGLAALPAQAGVIWYNGDFDQNDGLASMHNGGGSFGIDSYVYDNFTIASGTYDVSGVFGYFLSDTSSILGAQFEIRQAVGSADGGTVTASGSTGSASWSATATTLNSLTLYQLGMNVSGVALSPGTYWLGLRPILDPNQNQNAYAASTSGTNGTGYLAGNAYVDSAFFGYDFMLSTDGGYPADYSLGVDATMEGAGGVTPEPSTMLFGIGGLAGFLLLRRRRC